MTEFEKYKEHIQHTHNAFCRVVIRHAAIDAARRVHKRREREISLDYLMDEKYYPFSTTDEYFAEPTPDIDYPFTVCGQTVLLSNWYSSHSCHAEAGCDHHPRPDTQQHGFPCLRQSG